MKIIVLVATAILCKSARIEYGQVAQEIADASKESTEHKGELAASTGACYCACTKSYSAALFKSKNNVVHGTIYSLYEDKKNEEIRGGLYYYVEVRHIAKGIGSSKYKLMRSCDHSYCNNDDAAKHCGASKSDGTSALEFLKQNAGTLQKEANAKIEVTDSEPQGWSYIRAGKTIPSILHTKDPNIVVAVYWTTVYGGKTIRENLSGWGARVKPRRGDLAWGFQEILSNPDKRHVQVTPDVTSETAQVPKGMLVEAALEYEGLQSK